MACRVGELVLGCRDPDTLATFWCAVLDVVELDRDEDMIEIGPRSGFGGAQPTIILSRGDEPWHVLADPEGNVFCLLRGRLDPV